MLQKLSWLIAGDHTGVKWLKITHLYRGSSRRSTSTGFFVRIAVQVVYPPRNEYRGFKYKPIKKGRVTKALITRSAKERRTHDGGAVNFFENAGILLKKKKQPRTIHVIGPAPKHLRRKFYLALFEEHV